MDIAGLQKLCAEMLEIDKTIKEYKAEAVLLNKKLTRLMAEALEHLDQHEIESFDHGSGRIVISKKRSVKILDKFKFYEWLKEKEMFEQEITISVATATRIYNEELERAEDINDIDFRLNGIDGLSEPSVFRKISFKK